MTHPPASRTSAATDSEHDIEPRTDNRRAAFPPSLRQRLSPETDGPPFCSRCGHTPHDERDDPRCPEIVAANWGPDGPDPEYCGCVDSDALFVRMKQAERDAASPSVALDERALIDIIEQAIFETDTGLEAAILAAERIMAGRAADGESE